MHIIIDNVKETIFVDTKSIIDEISKIEILKINVLFDFYEIKENSEFDKLFELIENNSSNIVHIDYNTDKDNFHNISIVEKNPNTLNIDETNKVYKIEDSVILQEIQNVEKTLFDMAKEYELNSRNFYKDANGKFVFDLEKEKTGIISNMYNKFGAINENSIIYNNYKFKSLYITKQLLQDRTERDFIVYNESTLKYEVVPMTQSDFSAIDLIIADKLKTTYDALVTKVHEILACTTKDELDAVDLSCGDCN